jgi:hypothetical protein
VSTYADEPGAAAGRPSPSRAYNTEYEESSGWGWLIFAGTMLLLAGIVSLVYGIAAVAKSSFYVANTRFVFSDLKTWGWIVLSIGALECAAGLGVYIRAQWARWVGVGVASLNAIAQLLDIAAYPWLSVAVFSLDVLVVYGLVVHGGRLPERT